ncbi:MAG: ABC transporter substrate-binding protein [Actinomycetota bacterium]|nr:ABC transporter substrate-binding protein [Actinomycetota bacterium]
MDRRMFLRTTLAGAGAVAVASCTSSKSTTTSSSASVPGGPVPRPTLRLAGGDFGFPSPFAYVRGPGYWRMTYIYDSLLWKDSTGKLLPWLASRYDRSPDGLTYTFELRDNVTWNDGQPLTPDDVVFTFDYFGSQKLSPQIFVRPQDVAGVKATGPRTVEISLKKPVATFANSIAGALPIVPRHVWSSVADASKAQDPKLLVGTGPYRLDSYSRGEGSYLYTANDAYFLGAPFVKRIEMRPVQQGDELTPLRAGRSTPGAQAAPGRVVMPSPPSAPIPRSGSSKAPATSPSASTGTCRRAARSQTSGSARPACEPSTGPTLSAAWSVATASPAILGFFRPPTRPTCPSSSTPSTWPPPTASSTRPVTPAAAEAFARAPTASRCASAWWWATTPFHRPPTS